MSKLKSIEVINEEREESEVHVITLDCPVTWEPTGIESSFGGEILEKHQSYLPLYIVHGGKNRRIIKCSKTTKMGVMYLDGSIREIITDIEWSKG